MLYVLLIVVVAACAFLALRLRLRVRLTSERKLLFVGLGRSGPEYDFTSRTAVIKLFGLSLKTVRPSSAAKPEKEPKKARPAQKKKKPGRRRTVGDVLKVVPGVSRAAWRYAVSLLQSVIVEELEGEVNGGFDSPDMTGMAYGYYEAALAALPGVAGRFKFRPDWSGPAFDGSLKASLAIPMYRIVWRTVVLVFALPLRDLLKLAIGRKKGDSDGQ